MWSNFPSVMVVSIFGLSAGFISVTALLSDRTLEGVEIRRVEYGDRWPFAIEQARLRCENAGAIILTAKGTDYAVNGMAGGRYASIKPILRSAEHVSVGPIISQGLTLCNW